MNIIIRWAIQQVLQWAYSLTRADFENAFKYVQEAEKRYRDASDKKAFVVDALKKLMPTAGNRAINFLIELAVARLGNLQAR